MMSIVMTGDFYGLPTRILSNQHLRLEFLAEAGPRIVRLSLAGSGENLMAEVPDIHWTTPYGEYYLRGGHRLWHAPEAVPRSSVPDNDSLTVEGRDGEPRAMERWRVAHRACAVGHHAVAAGRRGDSASAD